MKKVAFVSIVGRPNVGKSSLLNTILNYDLSIVSSKPQTTRDQIHGIYNEDEYQIIFVDTPGIHKSKNKLGDALNNNSYDSLKDIDLILFLQPANEEIGTGDKWIIEKIKKFTNKIALITKVDLVDDKEILNQKAQELKDLGFEIVLGTSTSYKQTIEDLLLEIKKFAYDSEPFYNEEDITDKNMRFIAKEIIRESAINLLKHELPHNIAVVIEDFKENFDNPFEIEATIYVSKNSQKGILIGENGKMIKNIGINARKKMINQFNHPVILKTHVKVNKDWIDDEKSLKKMGY